MSVETVYLAGGCYWGMEELFRHIPGVVSTQVGFSGGHVPNVSYREVTTGTTGHAETLRVDFNPKQVSLAHLLFEFFRIHNPTQPNRQGNDIGSQYRSAIFYVTAEQRHVAQQVKQAVDISGEWGAPVVTEITALRGFYIADEKHQKYLMHYPDGYTCHFRRDLDLGESLFAT